MALTLKDSLQKMTTKTRIIVFIAILGTLFGCFLYFYHIPMKTEIAGLEKAIAEKKTIIAQNEARIRRLDELKAKVRALREQLEIMKEKLPPEKEVSTLLRQVQNEVNKAGLILKLWKPEKRKPHPSGLYEEIPISVKILGGYHNLGVFLDRVSKLSRIVNVQNLTMNGAKMEPNGTVNIKISFTALTFAATEKKIGTPSTPAPVAKKVN